METEHNLPSDSDETFSENDKPDLGYLKVWLVGDSDETQFLWDFLFERMEEFVQFSDVLMSGEIYLGIKNIFKATIVNVPKEAFETSIPKVEAEGVIICQNFLDVDFERSRINYPNYLRWGALKAVGFLNPVLCPSQFYVFSQKQTEDHLEENFEDFFKTMTLPKKENGLIRRKTTFFER